MTIDSPSHQDIAPPRTTPAAFRIMAVDDEEGVLAILKEHLKDEGYEVATFSDPRLAVEAASHEAYDLVITDIRMPGLDGLSLIREVKKQGPHTASIVLTGYASLETAVKALRNSVDDYITKPFDLELVSAVVRRTLDNYCLRRENVGLLDRLRVANRKLTRFSAELVQKVKEANKELIHANDSLRKRVRELQILNDVSGVVTGTLDVDRILETCLEIIAGKMGNQSSSLMMVDGSGAYLEVRAYRGPAPEEVMGKRQRVGEGIAGWVARERRPLHIKDIGKEPRFAKRTRQDRGYQTGSLLSVPLETKGKLLGVLNVNDKKDGKPFTQGDLRLLTTIASQVAITLDNADLYHSLQENALNTVNSLAISLEAKDKYTSGHSLRVTEYGLVIAAQMNLGKKDKELIEYAGVLHDIGKIGIPESTLTKKGPLTDAEWTLIRQPPIISERIISGLDFLSGAKSIVRHHHEWNDGSGYPDRLNGADLSLLTRILVVADAFDAMTSDRPYRKALTVEEAFAELRRSCPAQFDDKVVEFLLAALTDAEQDVMVKPA